MTITTRNKRKSYHGARGGSELSGRSVLLGVTGGIAAYKAVELARLLIKGGAGVQVVMTEAGAKFVAPLTFESITGRPVFIRMFPEPGEPSPWHTELATDSDIVVVAPATANHLAKLAAGFADDLLTTTLLACEKPRVLCPAMNPRMWANPATQDNLNTLRRRGYRIILPEEGEMARPGEDEGIGRLAEPDTICRELKHMLSAPQDLKSVHVLVTAGRTEESWDPVRVLTNRASGRMGFALAEEARERGADVVLIHGPTDVVPPTGVKRIAITTAREMTDAVMRELPASKIVLMSAAVTDYTFEKTARHKIKKGDPNPKISLTPTTDILKSISTVKGDRIVIGFALETENVLENALKKLRDKHLDIVVANNPLATGSGFRHDTNQVFLIHRGGRVIDLPLQSKREVARAILDTVIDLHRNPEPEPEPEEDLNIDVNEDSLGRVHLAGLDTLDEDEPESTTEDLSLNGQNGERRSRRRGGRRSRRIKDKRPTEVTPVEAAAVKKAEAAPDRKRAVKKRATKKTTSRKSSERKKPAANADGPKTATKKTVVKKTTRKTGRKKPASKPASKSASKPAAKSKSES